MRLFLSAFCSFLFLSAYAQVKFNEVYLFPENRSSSTERFIELKNDGALPVDLAGFEICTLRDSTDTQLSCNTLNSRSNKAFILQPKELTYLKINRNLATDNFLYLDLNHENKNVFILKDSDKKTIDIIDRSGKDKTKSLSRIEGDSWSVTYPTKGKTNRVTESTKFENNTASNMNTRELNWGNNPLGSKEESLQRDTKEEEVSANGKVFINEVFFVHEPDGYINKDFWIELVNSSDDYIEISQLTLTTDTTKDKTPLSFRYEGDESYELPPGGFIKINLTSSLSPYYLLYALIPDKSSTIYLYEGDQEIDRVKVQPLARHQSFSRLPDGIGGFMVVNVKTPGKSNDQVLPAYNTISKTTIFHTAGLSLTDYNTLDEKNITGYRPGFDLGLGWQKAKKNVLNRYSFAYSRQSSTITIDSVSRTNFGTINIQTVGQSKMDYFKFRFETGVALTQNINIFLGTGSSLLLKQFTTADQKIVAILDIDGTRFEENKRIEDVNAYRVDNLDLDVSLGIEYKIIDALTLNLSYSRDYFSLAASDDGGIPNNKTVNQFLIRAILPLYSSHKLSKRPFLFEPSKRSLGYNL